MAQSESLQPTQPTGGAVKYVVANHRLTSVRRK